MKKVLPIVLGLAATVSMIGCMQTNPVAGSLNVSSVPAAHFVINFNQPAGYATKAAGDHHVELRIMYTEAVVRAADFNTDYHIGLAAGTNAYKFNYAATTPVLGAQINSLYYKAGQLVTDDPIFADLQVPASSDSINPATASANYILDAGIYATAAGSTSSIDMFEDPTATSSIACYSKADDVLSAKVLISAAEGMFTNLFSKAIVTKSGGATASFVTTLPTLNALPYTGNPAKATVTRILNKVGASATTTTNTLYYKFILPAGVQSIDLGTMPLGRVIIDYRSYEGDGSQVSKYGYGQFLLAPNNNTLDINAMSGTPGATSSMTFGAL